MLRGVYFQPLPLLVEGGPGQVRKVVGGIDPEADPGEEK
jgi:hypothetical protein